MSTTRQAEGGAEEKKAGIAMLAAAGQQLTFARRYARAARGIAVGRGRHRWTHGGCAARPWPRAPPPCRPASGAAAVLTPSRPRDAARPKAH
eukprot:7372513-Prymnesium_polylepis.1